MPNQIRSRRQRAIQPFVQKRMALALAAAFSMPSIAATVNWDGGGNNSFWSTATNWDGNVLPGSLDAVVIGSGFSVVHDAGTTSILSLTAGNLSIAGGSLSMSAASSISQLTLTSATLANSATTTVGSATLTGATLNGSGKTILANGGNHNIGGTGYAYNYLNQGHSLQNEGQLQIASTGSGQKYLFVTGSSNGVAASRLVNKGEMTLAADANASVQIYRNGGNADAAFDNSGKLTKNGAGLASVSTQFNNTGDITVNDGILSLDGVSSHSAVSTISGNGTLRLGNASHSFADGFVGNIGLIQLQSGTLQGASGSTLKFLGTLEVNSGTIRDAAVVQIANAKLTNATLSGNGKTILASGGNHNIGGTGYTYNYLNQGHTLQNEGQLQISSTGSGQKYLFVTGSSNGVAASRLVNKGEMTLAADANASVQIYRNGGNADAALDNSGKLTKNGAGLASISTQFNNTGNVVLNDGILALEGGSSHSSASGISGNGTLRLGSGTHSFADGFVSHAGLTQLQNGTLQGVAGSSLNFLGSLEGSGGTIRDAALLQVANAKLSGTTIKDVAEARLAKAELTGVTLSGNGKTILASGGNHNIGGTGYTYNYLNQGHTLQNEGQLQISSTGSGQKSLYITGSSNGVAASRLVNKGELTLAADANTAVYFYRNGGNADAAFDNGNKLTKNGVGLASISTQFNNTGNVVLNDGILALEGGSSHSSASGISGNGTLRLGSGTHSFADGFVSHAGLTQLQNGTLQGVAGSSLNFLGSLEGNGGTIRDAALLQVANAKLSGTTIKDVAEARLAKAELTGVTLSGNGKTILASGGNHSIGGTGYIYNYVNQGHTLQNEGQLQISSTGSGQKSLSIAGSSNGVAASRLVNKGEMTLAADANTSVQINRNGGNADAALDNSGKLTKNGVGLASIGVQFNNTGNVVLNDGILALEGGSSHSSASGISGNGTLRLGSGIHSFADGYVNNVALTRLQSGVMQGVAGGSLSLLGTLEAGSAGIRNAALLQVANAKLSYTTMQDIALARLGNADLTAMTFTGNGKTVLASGGSHTLNSTNMGYASYLKQGHTLQNDGQLRVDAGGVGQANYLYVEGSGNGIGASRLGDAASKIVNNGEMTLSSSGGNLMIQRYSGNNDVVFENSGKLIKDGTGNAQIYAMTLQNTGNVHVQQGKLQYTNTPMQNNGRVIVDAGATFEASLVNNGRLMGNGTVIASAGVENHGVVAPGASAGTLSITGNYVQGADGRLDIELGGLLPGVDFDRLLVSGNATLNGVLDVTHLAGYAPKIGDSFIVLASSRLYGTFSSLSLHGFGNGTQINVSYLDGADADSYADYVRLDVAAVPEPETYAMMLAGLGVVGWSLRKRKLAMH